MSAWVELATVEAIAALRLAGLEIAEWSVLSQTNRVVLELKPCQLIAKVVPVSVRNRLALELAVAKHVAARSGPVALPAQPASRSGPFQTPIVAVSVWESLAILGVPPESAVCSAYTALRGGLDSFAEALPDFRDAIEEANRLLRQTDLSGMSEHDTSFLRVLFERALSRLASFEWETRVLHGDPHSGNVVLTPAGPKWLDLESVCTGPIEWDLSALPGCSASVHHDRDLLSVLVALRRACVVVWCASKANPSPTDAEAIAHHLTALKT
jgi:Ser/Thr protein kinase RdoA (MazF antagonist)